MRLGWKVFVPLAIVWIFVAGCLVYFGVVGPAPAVEAMLKIGGYGFIRFSLPIVPDASQEYAWVVIAMSLIAVIYIGFVALVQEDMESPDRQIRLMDAVDVKAEIQVGEFIEEPIENPEFGRIAAQAAKQVIVQRVREAERAQVVEAYKDRVGELVTGVVKRVERGSVYLDLGGNAEAYIPRDRAIPREAVRAGDRVRGYLYEVRAEQRGPQLFVSRTAPEFMAWRGWIRSCCRSKVLSMHYRSCVSPPIRSLRCAKASASPRAGWRQPVFAGRSMAAIASSPWSRSTRPVRFACCAALPRRKPEGDAGFLVKMFCVINIYANKLVFIEQLLSALARPRATSRGTHRRTVPEASQPPFFDENRLQ